MPRPPPVDELLVLVRRLAITLSRISDRLLELELLIWRRRHPPR
jgi:hypothetical protein